MCVMFKEKQRKNLYKDLKIMTLKVFVYYINIFIFVNNFHEH